MLFISLRNHVLDVVWCAWHQLPGIGDLGYGEETLICPDLLDKGLHCWNKNSQPASWSFHVFPLYEVQGN
jgi:hypothetical protein